MFCFLLVWSCKNFLAYIFLSTFVRISWVYLGLWVWSPLPALHIAKWLSKVVAANTPPRNVSVPNALHLTVLGAITLLKCFQYDEYQMISCFQIQFAFPWLLERLSLFISSWVPTSVNCPLQQPFLFGLFFSYFIVVWIK